MVTNEHAASVLAKLYELQGVEYATRESDPALTSLATCVASAVNEFGGGPDMFLDAVFVGMAYYKLTSDNIHQLTGTNRYALN